MHTWDLIYKMCVCTDLFAERAYAKIQGNVQIYKNGLWRRKEFSATSGSEQTYTHLLCVYIQIVFLEIWMNEWCIYIALYCVLLYTQSALQSWGGGGSLSPQPPPVCSIHLDDATAATGQRRQCTHHTPATGGEERESLVPVKLMGIIRRPGYFLLI